MIFPDEPLAVVSDESTSIPPIELTNGMKRPLLNESEDGEEIKKIKLTENVNEEEFEVSSLNSKNNKEEENHMDIDKNLDQITENNSDDHLNVSNKNNSEKDTSSNHIDDKASNIDTNDQNKCTIDVNKPCNTNVENDNCEPVISKTIINSTESESVNTNETLLIQDDQITNDNSLPLKMPLEMLDNEDSKDSLDNEGVDKIPLLTERLEVDNESKLLNNNSFTNESEIKNIENRKNVQLSPVSNTHSSVTENTDEITMIESVNDHDNYTAVEEVSNNNDNDCVFIESESSSDMDDDELLNNLLKDNKTYGKKYFPNLLKFFSQKNLTYEVRQ